MAHGLVSNSTAVWHGRCGQRVQGYRGFQGLEKRRLMIYQGLGEKDA